MAKSPDQRLGDRLEAMDAAILEFAKLTKADLLRMLARMGIKDKLRLAKTVTRLKVKRKQIGGDKFVQDPFLTASLRYRIVRKQGEIEAVGFSFARHGIFIEHGVGKGRPKGSGAAMENRRPWLSNVLPSALENLADVLEAEYADIAAATLVMSIPGVLEGRSSVQLGQPRTRTAQQQYEKGEEDWFIAALNEDIRRMRSSYRSTPVIPKF